MNCDCGGTPFLVGKKVRELQDLAEGNLLVLAIQRADGNVPAERLSRRAIV